MGMWKINGITEGREYKEGLREAKMKKVKRRVLEKIER